MPWLRTAASSTPSSSAAAVAVTVCAVFHVLVVNVSRAGFAATSALSLETATPMPAAQPVGGVSGRRVYVPRLAFVAPGFSSSARLVLLSVSPGAAATVTAFETSATPPCRLAAGTRTASVGRPRKSPSKASVRVAAVPPAVMPETCEMERFGMAPALTSSNAPTPAAGAPAENAALTSDSASVAPSRFVSVSAAGVGAMATPVSSSATVTETVPMDSESG